MYYLCLARLRTSLAAPGVNPINQNAGLTVAPIKMKTQSRLCAIAMTGMVLASTALLTQAQQIKWGLTLTNINNPITPIVATNGDGSISITAGGGDTYNAPDSFTYAYQQASGDFDIAVQVLNVTATDVFGQDTPKGSLMLRATLDATTQNVQINATPPSPSNRNGQIESIGRILPNDTDDLPGRLQQYGGDTTASDYCTYPDVWLRIQRQGQKVMTYFKTANATDFPSGYGPGSTNGWQLLTVAKGTNFPKTVYIGLSTVSHNNSLPGGIGDLTHTVTATYANYGPVSTPASNPSTNGVAVPASIAPGPFPNKKVLAANFDASVAADGLGYPPDIVQSSQGAPQQIIWNSGGFGGVARDIIANIGSQTPGGFSFARYQAGAFDFLLSPRDPVAAVQHLGPYTNPLRERYGSGNPTVAASQAWSPSPNYGFVFTTVRKNGQQWNDTAPFFYAATYVQLDDSATAQAYDMIGGHFRGAQFYTRTTKLVTGSPTDPLSDLNNLQRCAMPISIAWFPYEQGWKAGYFNPPAGTSEGVWKRGNGWGLNSGTAVNGLPMLGGQNHYNSPETLMNWVDTGGGIYAGLAVLSLPGVNSVNDGMLFTIGNDEADGKRGPSANNAAKPDGSGWYVAVRDIETSKADPTIYASGSGNDARASFSFLYVPYNSDNLVGGHIRTNGTVANSAGNFSIARLSTGRYSLTIPGKTSTNGVLLLQNAGYLANQPVGMTNVVDTSVLSYEYGGTNSPANAFIIESRYVDMTGGGEGAVTLRDAEFNFVYVDFLNPLAPPGTLPPTLNIGKSGNNVIVSWTNGAGFVLQKTSSLTPTPTWTDVGTANPSAPIAITSSNLFFRVQSP